MKPIVLEPPMLAVFGSPHDPMHVVEARARAEFGDRAIIVWEGDPQTFVFEYVGGDAERLLGHPASHWLKPDFWVASVVHPDDRDDAVAFCALATGKGMDHVFEYRAITTGGEVRWLEDYVRVIKGDRGVPIRLRGLMLDVTERKQQSDTAGERPTLFVPSVATLERL